MQQGTDRRWRMSNREEPATSDASLPVFVAGSPNDYPTPAAEFLFGRRHVAMRRTQGSIHDRASSASSPASRRHRPRGHARCRQNPRAGGRPTPAPVSGTQGTHRAIKWLRYEFLITGTNAAL